MQQHNDRENRKEYIRIYAKYLNWEMRNGDHPIDWDELESTVSEAVKRALTIVVVD